MKTSEPAPLRKLEISPPPTGGGILGPILNTCESYQIFNSQLNNKKMTLLLTHIALMRLFTLQTVCSTHFYRTVRRDLSHVTRSLKRQRKYS